MFKPIQAFAPNVGQSEPQSIDDAGIKRVFMVLHGFYGNLFLSKFSTGSVEANGEDQGIANARRIWAYSLREYDADTIKAALRRCQTSHPEFPPSLPQFVSICAAVKPRQAYKPATLPAIGMSEELWAKRRQEHLARATEAARKVREVEDAGLNPLKRAIAAAVAEAGGDEVAALLRLDRMFPNGVTQ
jgi:hypothetical protein